MTNSFDYTRTPKPGENRRSDAIENEACIREAMKKFRAIIDGRPLDALLRDVNNDPLAAFDAFMIEMDKAASEHWARGH